PALHSGAGPGGDRGHQALRDFTVGPDETDDMDAAAGLRDLRDHGVEDVPVVDEVDRVSGLQADGGGLVERVREVGAAIGSLGSEVHLADWFAPDTETRRRQESERESDGV